MIWLIINMNIEKIVNLYNDCFWYILLIVLLFFLLMGITLYSKMKGDGDKDWYSFVVVLKREIIQMMALGFIIFFLVYFLNESFSINVVELLQVIKYWKIIFGIWILLHMISGKELYNKINFSDFLQQVKDDKRKFTTPEKTFLDIIERYNANYIIQVEKLGILKSLTPISLLPLIVGYIIEGKDISVNWNWYTVVFFAILFLYLYNLWKCYKNMKFWKLYTVEVQKELRDIQCQDKK